MKNIKTSIRGNILTIRVDLSQEHGLTESRRSILVACSMGSIQLWERGSPRAEKFNISVWKPLTREEQRAQSLFL